MFLLDLSRRKKKRTELKELEDGEQSVGLESRKRLRAGRRAAELGNRQGPGRARNVQAGTLISVWRRTLGVVSHTWVETKQELLGIHSYQCAVTYTWTLGVVSNTWIEALS